MLQKIRTYRATKWYYFRYVNRYYAQKFAFTQPWGDLHTLGTAANHVFIHRPLEPNAIADPPCLKTHDDFAGEKVKRGAKAAKIATKEVAKASKVVQGDAALEVDKPNQRKKFFAKAPKHIARDVLQYIKLIWAVYFCGWTAQIRQYYTRFLVVY